MARLTDYEVTLLNEVATQAKTIREAQTELVSLVAQIKALPRKSAASMLDIALEPAYDGEAFRFYTGDAV